MPSPTKSPTSKKSSTTTGKELPPVKQAKSTGKAALSPKKSPAATQATRMIPPAATITTSEERYRLIAEAAYYLAEKRGFQNGSPEQDWFDAVVQVDKIYME